MASTCWKFTPSYNKKPANLHFVGEKENANTKSENSLGYCCMHC